MLERLGLVGGRLKANANECRVLVLCVYVKQAPKVSKDHACIKVLNGLVISSCVIHVRCYPHCM